MRVDDLRDITPAKPGRTKLGRVLGFAIGIAACVLTWVLFCAIMVRLIVMVWP